MHWNALEQFIGSLFGEKLGRITPVNLIVCCNFLSEHDSEHHHMFLNLAGLDFVCFACKKMKDQHISRVPHELQ